MPIPKIIFRYSPIYNKFWRKIAKDREKPKKSLSKRKILNYIKSVERLWRKDEKKILKEISKITKLKWQEEQIYCYIIERGVSISEPITILMFKDLSFFVDVLTHELIHRIFATKGNYKKSKKAWDYIHRKYKNETKRTRTHIVIQAIHAHIYLKFYDEGRLKRDIQWHILKSKKISSRKDHLLSPKDYIRAWKIIQKAGYQKIINEFRKRIS